MSEAIAGIPAAPPPARARDAAAVILFRRAASGLEVFWLRRGARLSFAAGFYAFPGGALDPDDAGVPVEGAEGLDAALRAAAVRELFEETGVLCAEGAERLTDTELSRLRAAVLAGTASFGTALRAQNLRLSRRHLLDAGRWVTPAFMSSRFDARFFLLELPRGQLPQFWPGEHAEGGWVSPSDALRKWEEGTTLLHPPSLHAMRILGAFTGVEEIAERLRDPPNCSDYIPERIEFQRGIRMFPLRTPTLPPATHTNCYLLGDGELLIVDPGASDPAECERLFAFLAELAAEGMKPKAIFLTHHHSDHVGGVTAVKRRLGLPIWCHELTASRLSERADRLIAEGEWLVLSGDMSDYLDQLRRMRALPVGALYPSHGPVIADGPGKLTEYLEHRAAREQRVFNAVVEGQSTIARIVAAAYTDVVEFVHPIAARSTEAILIKLVREGKVNREGDRYFAVS